MEVCLTKDVKFNVGKTFNGRSMKNMSLITVFIDPSELMDKNTFSSRGIPIYDYPLFTKEDP